MRHSFVLASVMSLTVDDGNDKRHTCHVLQKVCAASILGSQGGEYSVAGGIRQVEKSPRATRVQ